MDPKTAPTNGPNDRYERPCWPWLRPLLVGLAVVGTFPAVVSAHVPSAGASVGFRFPVLIGGSALIGSVGGIAVVACRSRYVADRLARRRVGGIIGMGLTGLGGVVLLPIIGSRPILSVGSVVGGLLGAAMLSAHKDAHPGPLEIASVTGALTLHQLIEGAVLTGAYVTGGVVGVAAALVLTLHTVAETATVAGAHTMVGQYRRGAAAVVFMQAVYVVAAGLTFALAWSIPALAEDVTATVVAGVLLVVGLHESWRAARKSVVGFVPFGEPEDPPPGVEDRNG